MFKKKKKDTVDEQQDSQSRKSGIKIGKVAGGVIAFFLAGYLLVGSIYSLKENEYAVITITSLACRVWWRNRGFM